MNNDEYVKISDNLKLLFKGRRKPLAFSEIARLYRERFINVPVSDLSSIKLMVLNLVSSGYLKLDGTDWRVSKNKKA